MKQCYKCKTTKDLSEFSKDKTTFSGLNAKCKLCVKIYSIEYEKMNEENIRNRKRSYYLKNKENINAKNSQWKKNNPNYANEYQKKRRESDPEFKLKDILRQRLNKAIAKDYKKGSAIKLLGCNVTFLRFYLESKFKPGMTWRNHGIGRGKWNIDHIRPLSSFNLSEESEIKIACHFTNLQPLWSEENISKGSNYESI